VPVIPETAPVCHRVGFADRCQSTTAVPARSPTVAAPLCRSATPWGILENHWNGAPLESIPTALRFAQTMTWHGKHPFVELIDKIYHKGVKLTAAEMKQLEAHVQRLPGLEKWFVDIPRR
jgi:hypothetical protein